MEFVLQIILILLGAGLIGLGFYGCFGPIPGPPIALIAPVALQLMNKTGHTYFNLGKLTIPLFVIIIFLTIAIAILDYFIPIYGTKKFGGTKAGIRGSTIGLIVGFILSIITSGFGLILVIAGPFIGAYFGEKYGGANNKQALKAALGSFAGFLAGTAGKLVVTFFIAIIFIIGAIAAFF